LSRGVHKRVKGSKNRRKKNSCYQEEHRKVTNRKKDLKNKIVRKLTNKYDTFYAQVESPEEWKQGNKKGVSKGVQESSVGGLYSDLKKKADTFNEVSRWEKTSGKCMHCGHEQEIKLECRVYSCHWCGRKTSRDFNAANTIYILGKFGKEYWDVRNLYPSAFDRWVKGGKSLVEFQSLLKTLKGDKQVGTLKQEAVMF
jgi:putative transposase